MITSAVKCSNFDQKLHQILVLRKELHNLNHLISSHKKTIMTKHDGTFFLKINGKTVGGNPLHDT